jgi:hypothetical protein
VTDDRLRLKKEIVCKEPERLKCATSRFYNSLTDSWLFYLSSMVKLNWRVTHKDRATAGHASTLQ